MGCGMGVWVLGFGDWVLGPIPNPQSPFPNPQSPIPIIWIIKNNYKGSCINFIKDCNRDATKLVKKIIDEFCCYRDQAIYKEEQIFFYKRAQILVSDLYLSYLDIKEAKKDTSKNEIINYTK